VEISGKQGRADRYLDAVEREIALVVADLGDRRHIVQMHWGGGTPTFLSVEQLRRLHGMLAAAFELGGEQSIEVDPHVTTPEQTDLLFDLGFNRVSMGVQDLDPIVQSIVRRDQTYEETERLIEQCRERGADGVNVDLMYGLPGQTLEGFGNTLDVITRWKPDRLAVFGYAHVPWLKPAQKALEQRADIPVAELRTALFGLALERLTGSGYEVIGLDHFALSTDEMWRCLQDGTLHRNFMGYATQPTEDMVGLGMSAIGDVAGAFLQNARDTATYEARLTEGRLPTVRGLVRSEEDELRRSVILSLMCKMAVDLDQLEAATGRTDLADHFATEWAELAPFAEQGLCSLQPRRLEVTPTGRLFLRHMGMVFDEYLRKKRPGDASPRFSQTL
jgi:oxygen-independent coproporphyrinogen-3 oxidase